MHPLHVILTLAILQLHSMHSAPAHDALAHFVTQAHSRSRILWTKHWGIIYHKSKSDQSLPPLYIYCIALPSNLPLIPALNILHSACRILWWCATGYAFVLCAGDTSCCCKTQSIITMGSTKATFLTAVAATKHAWFLCGIINNLVLHEQNLPCIAITNLSSTWSMRMSLLESSCHLDIKHFVIQDWKDDGDVLMEFIKPLRWILRERHACCMMDHC